MASLRSTLYCASVAILAEVAQASDTCVGLQNNYDGASYTTKAFIGSPPQPMYVVPDTGSYSLVIDSDLCTSHDCKSHNDIFHVKKSSTFNLLNVETTPSYGQGWCIADMAKDKLTIAGQADVVTLFAISESHIEGFDGAEYTGILGLGKRWATTEAPFDGSGDPADIVDILKANNSTVNASGYGSHYTDNATDNKFDGNGNGEQEYEPMPPHKPALTSLGVEAFYVCLGPTDVSGNDVGGRLDLAPPPQEATSEQFRKIETVGENAWATPFAQISVNGNVVDINGGITPYTNETSFMPSLSQNARARKFPLHQSTKGRMKFNGNHAGTTGPPVAIIDTGTTLMTFPYSVLESIYYGIDDECPGCIDELNEMETCSGPSFNKLPNIEMQLGNTNQKAVLKPEHYMGVFVVEIDEEVQMGPFDMVIPVGFEPRCVMLMEAIDMPSNLGPIAILGMPFMRAYAVEFNRKKEQMSIAQVADNRLCYSCGSSTSAFWSQSRDGGKAIRSPKLPKFDRHGGEPLQAMNEANSSMVLPDDEAAASLVQNSKAAISMKRVRQPWYAVAPHLRPKGLHMSKKQQTSKHWLYQV